MDGGASDRQLAPRQLPRGESAEPAAAAAERVPAASTSCFALLVRLRLLESLCIKHVCMLEIDATILVCLMVVCVCIHFYNNEFLR